MAHAALTVGESHEPQLGVEDGAFCAGRHLDHAPFEPQEDISELPRHSDGTGLAEHRETTDQASDALHRGQGRSARSWLPGLGLEFEHGQGHTSKRDEIQRVGASDGLIELMASRRPQYIAQQASIIRLQHILAPLDQADLDVEHKLSARRPPIGEQSPVEVLRPARPGTRV